MKEERYKKVVFGDIVIEVEGSFITARKGENGELILNPVRIPEESPEESHFLKITSTKRKKIRRWVKTQKGETEREKDFLKIVRKALNKIHHDYWIATMEPTIIDGKIKYIEGEEVAVGYSCNEWKTMAEEYMPERGSRLASLYELFLFYAYRIVREFWTLSYVANDSSSAGNYRNSLNHYNGIERAGAREAGGFRDGVGNTYKIVTHEVRYALCGGNFDNNGSIYPVGDVGFDYYPSNTLYNSSGVLVLTK